MESAEPFGDGGQRFPDLHLLGLLGLVDVQEGEFDVSRERLIVSPCKDEVGPNRVSEEPF
jgi:hypothetical protein